MKKISIVLNHLDTEYDTLIKCALVSCLNDSINHGDPLEAIQLESAINEAFCEDLVGKVDEKSLIEIKRDMKILLDNISKEL